MLDIDRDRQRISLGLKQTQEDPWQRVVDTYNVGDELEGTVTKVVTFGAFVEILDGVEGLVHISELAPHHVENPREIVAPGDEVKVKILEIDSERRRLSLSVKRVEGQVLEPKILPPEELAATASEEDEALAREHGAGDLDDLPELGLSEEVFAGDPAAAAAEPAEAIAGTDAEAGVDEEVAALAADPAPDSDAATEPEAVAAEAPVAEEPEAVEPEADDPAAAEPAADEPAAT